jgi:hypothetical protein
MDDAENAIPTIRWLAMDGVDDRPTGERKWFRFTRAVELRNERI